MTAEIAIMNKSAIALAADSAITIGSSEGGKVYNTVHKLFRLSDYHPVGTMIYHNAQFMGIPWETLIKMYRDQIGAKSQNTIRDYADDFFTFILDRRFSDEDRQAVNVYDILVSFYNDIQSEISGKLLEIVTNKGRFSRRDLNKITSKIVDEGIEYFENLDDIEYLGTTNPHILIRKYDHAFEAAHRYALPFPLSQKIVKKLRKFSGLLLVKDYFSKVSSGLVVAGFGNEEVFPTMLDFSVDGIINDGLKIQIQKEYDISRGKTEAAIRPFAQSEMVHRFMEGVDPNYQDYLEAVASRLLYNYGAELINIHASGDDKQKARLKRGLRSTVNAQMEKFSERCASYRGKTYVDPITNVLVHLPKTELANMAEALVNLTSLKRKVSDEKETVGGQIDVAVISKGDGFVWVKRKGYFDPMLNPHLKNRHGLAKEGGEA